MLPTSFAPAEQSAEPDEVCLVNITASSVTVYGGIVSGEGPKAPVQQVDASFNPGQIDGKNACIQKVPRVLADQYLRHHGAVLKILPSRLGKKLYDATKAKGGTFRALQEAWVEVLKAPWPGSAERNATADERLKLMKSLKERFYEVDPRWTMDQLRRYAARPELIFQDKAEAEGLPVEDDIASDPTVEAAAKAEDDSAIEEFLRMQKGA